MVDTRKLRGKIAEAGLSVPKLAKQISIDRVTLYRRLSNPKNFTIKEVNAIVSALELSVNDANSIFFAQEFAYNENNNCNHGLEA